MHAAIRRLWPLGDVLAAVFILAAFDAAIVALARGNLAAALVAGLLAILGVTAKETTAAILPLVAAFHWANRDRLRLAAGKSTPVRPVLYGGLALISSCSRS